MSLNVQYTIKLSLRIPHESRKSDTFWKVSKVFLKKVTLLDVHHFLKKGITFPKQLLNSASTMLALADRLQMEEMMKYKWVSGFALLHPSKARKLHFF